MSTRDERIADYRRMLDFLAEHPEVPLGAPALNSYHVSGSGSNDEAGLAELRRIAAALDVEITHNADASHFYADRQFGSVRYRALHILKHHMDEHVEVQRYAEQRREELRAAEQGEPTEGGAR